MANLFEKVQNYNFCFFIFTENKPLLHIHKLTLFPFGCLFTSNTGLQHVTLNRVFSRQGLYMNAYWFLTWVLPWSKLHQHDIYFIVHGILQCLVKLYILSYVTEYERHVSFNYTRHDFSISQDTLKNILRHLLSPYIIALCHFLSLNRASILDSVSVAILYNNNNNKT